MHMSAHWTRSTDYTSNPEGFGLDSQTHRHFTGLLSRRPMKPCRYGPSLGVHPFHSVNVAGDAFGDHGHGGCYGFSIHGRFRGGGRFWVQFRITLAEASEAWSWVGNDMQKHIAWELLAQFALTFCIESSLPRCRGPVNVNRERTTALRTQPRQRACL